MDGSDVRVYAVIGDGECQEGEVWEAALFAPHQKLDNLTVLLDYNKGQVDGFVADIEAVAPHELKWEAFGWDVQRVDGHDVLAAAAAIEKARMVSGKPQLIVLDTVKGFVPFEGKPSTHSMAVSKEQAAYAIKKLGEGHTVSPHARRRGRGDPCTDLRRGRQ